MKRALFLVLCAGIVLGFAGGAAAHPLGNFTVNTYAGLRISASAVDVDYVLDMAEIPAFQERSAVSAAGPAAWAAGRCSSIASAVDVVLDERRLPLTVGPSTVTFPAGAAGLDTLRLECRFTGSGSGSSLRFLDRSVGDHIGWHELTAVGDGTTITSGGVATASVSQRLTAYPTGSLQTPLDQRTATLSYRAGGAPAAAVGGDRAAAAIPRTRGVDALTRSFTSLVGRHDTTVGFVVLAVLLSVLLGAAHALAPGHGKTVMAAYLVGQRGNLRQAMAVAAGVTVTHTAGVLALGIVLTTGAVVAPERLYPWLGLGSGLLVALIGVGILRSIVHRRAHTRRPAVHVHTHAPAPAPARDRVLVGVGGHAHEGHDLHAHEHDDHHHHDHGHTHSHGVFGREHSHAPAAALGDQPLTWRSLLAMGFAGGLVPSPSALVVLLGAIALGRAWFGVALVVAYGLGMAATLVTAGLLLLKARTRLERWTRNGERLRRLTTWIPAATAAGILVGGLALAAKAAAAL